MTDPSGAPTSEVTDVEVAGTTAAPGGEVVVIRTAAGRLELVVGHPHDFAALLDRRLRLLREPDWS